MGIQEQKYQSILKLLTVLQSKGLQ